MRILGFGTYDTAAHPRIAVILDGLRLHGAVIDELDEPLGLSTRERVVILRQPWRLPILGGRIAARWWSLARGSRLRRGSNAPDAVVVGYMGHFDVLLARLLFPRRLVVLDHLIFASGTAVDRGVSRGLRVQALALLDRLAIGAADIIVVDTQEHFEMLPTGRRRDGVVVPVGAGRAWTEAARPPGETALARTGRLSVVFFGLFTPLQGTVTIARAIRRCRDQEANIDFTLVGDGQDAEEVRSILTEVAGIRWESWVDRDALAEVVATHDVCLGIFGTTTKALKVVPNKVYQGAAAGCCVVTSDTGPQRRALRGGAILVPPGDAEALATELVSLSSDPARLAAMRERAATVASQHFTPGAVTDPLVRALKTRGVWNS